CQPANTLMSLSGQTNAHGEAGSGGIYPYVLCDSVNTRPTSCSQSNIILNLSGQTNAQGEIPTGNLNYPIAVCAQNIICGAYTVQLTEIDKTCEQISPAAADGNTIEVLSLSSPTNAHIAKFRDYTTKICCREISTQCPSPNGIFIYPNINSPASSGYYFLNHYINFDASGSRALSCTNSVATVINENQLTYSWSIGAENIGTGKVVTKQFTTVGNYEVVLNAIYTTASAELRRTFTVGAICENSVIEEGEDCEVNPLNLDGETCISLGFESGTLGCNPPTCKFDISQCILPSTELPTVCSDITRSEYGDSAIGLCNSDLLVEDYIITPLGGNNLCKVNVHEFCVWNTLEDECRPQNTQTPIEDGVCSAQGVQYCSYSSSIVGSCESGDDFLEISYLLDSGTSECQSAYSRNVFCSDLNTVPFFTLFNFFSVISVLFIFYLFTLKNKS
ncbi:MAG: hypothetical protein AABY22_05445, partial [Nanoarchaeota archaeon]